MSPTDYRVDNESLLIGGEVCLWTEYADDDSIMPRLWSALISCLSVVAVSSVLCRHCCCYTLILLYVEFVGLSFVW